jgi:hypothetical protein
MQTDILHCLERLLLLLLPLLLPPLLLLLLLLLLRSLTSCTARTAAIARRSCSHLMPWHSTCSTTSARHSTAATPSWTEL